MFEWLSLAAGGDVPLLTQLFGATVAMARQATAQANAHISETGKNLPGRVDWVLIGLFSLLRPAGGSQVGVSHGAREGIGGPTQFPPRGYWPGRR